MRNNCGAKWILIWGHESESSDRYNLRDTYAGTPHSVTFGVDTQGTSLTRTANVRQGFPFRIVILSQKPAGKCEEYQG